MGYNMVNSMFIDTFYYKELDSDHSASNNFMVKMMLFHWYDVSQFAAAQVY